MSDHATQLLLIDPQTDFCSPDGALAVAGADADMQRVAALLARAGERLDALTVTLDTHHRLDIAHPGWWRDAHGAPPPPFTLVTTADLAAGRWRTARPDDAARSAEYVAALERAGRFPLCLWPPHCLIGSVGNAVYPPLFAALRDWEVATGQSIVYVRKGENPATEHYSALRAEIPDPDDPATALNAALVARLARAERLFVAGEAGSHCVAHTLRDLFDAVPALATRTVLLRDAVSPVPGFEAAQTAFLDEAQAQGMRLRACEEAARELLR